jgi:hypothetical protein
MTASTLIATILRYDRKTASYKIALIRALNDLALGYPLPAPPAAGAPPLAVPLRQIALHWLAYYWPFADPAHPIKQGRQTAGKEDISFRPQLTELRLAWDEHYGLSRPSDGFFVLSEVGSPFRRERFSPNFLLHLEDTLTAIAKAVHQPIEYAGAGHWSIFPRPARWAELQRQGLAALPGAQSHDLCLAVDAALWASLGALSLWIEALCLHEWALFTEAITAGSAGRGLVYTLLTDRPDNRRPLTWERNQIELLMLEQKRFLCPWTGRLLTPATYDLDHLLPLSVYPINELWNLVPADARFNRHEKRDLLPAAERLHTALPRLATTYGHYLTQPATATLLRSDLAGRFAGQLTGEASGREVAETVAGYLQQVAVTRVVRRF